MRKVLIAICLFCLVFFSFQFPARAENDSQIELLERFMNESMEKYGIPGASLAIIQNGELMFQESWGEQRKGTPVTKDTLFTIGSISKPLTSLAIMRLVDDKMIELDQEIDRYLPAFHYDRNGFDKKITIRHLLTHTSGISSYDGLDVADRNLRGENAINVAVQNLNNVHLNYEPGEVHQYSAANYLLLGRIIENVTNQTFSEFMDDEIFSEIGMSRTVSDFESAKELGYQPGYQSWFGKPVKSRGIFDDSGAPYGYMVSTTGDMSKFIKILLDGDKILSKDSFNTYTSPHYHRKEDMYYGLGWRISTEVDNSYYFHGGETPDSRAELFINPQQDYGFILLTNKNNFSEVLSTVRMREGIKMIVEEGKSPKVQQLNHHMQWSTFIVTLFLLLLSSWNLYRLIKKTKIKSKVWIFIGVLSILLSIIMIPLIIYLFNSPWNTINLYAPAIAILIKVLVGILATNGVLLLFVVYFKKSSVGD
ncbi:serine hydrolase domain-containing protein [Rossellomorea aquimaris]|uniref:serine hydrolase domain-containing protein n=1 Tax=Rossellomorea aquimaris TaxID=189382 RepID=UPI000697485C|nr:serine hydrolase [Rossellomorea aquimaris]